MTFLTFLTYYLLDALLDIDELLEAEELIDDERADDDRITFQ